MNASTVNFQMKKVVCFLPEIWYTLFCISSIAGTGSYLFRTGWNTFNVISLLLFSCIAGLLIRQFFKTNGWISFIMGFLFTLGSCYMSLALLSEYREFPLGTEPRAISLITFGGLLIGTSLVLAIWMLIKGIRKIQS